MWTPHYVTIFFISLVIELMINTINANASSSPEPSSLLTTTSTAVDAQTSSKVLPAPTPRKLVIGVDGGTESIRACCFDAMDGSIVGKSCAVPYKTHHPKSGWAEQMPEDWYNNLGEAVRGALKSVDDECENKNAKAGAENFDENANNESEAEAVSEEENGMPDAKSRVCAICIDTTCCSVVALDEDYTPLRPSLLWMDARSAPQTAEIMQKCKGDKALKVNCNGKGPLSAEWMTPKSLWIKQNEPEVWEKAKTICEYQDYINYKLTGRMCASSCNAAARWHWDGEECIKDDGAGGKNKHKYPGRPMSLYRKLGMPELADKLPQECLSMGSLVGKLHKEAAEHLGLNEGTPVAQGGPDAFVGMVGLGCIHPQQLCLITGSSHLHCVVTSKPTTAKGSWGAYRGAPLPGINFAEGGQSSTGSIIRWAKTLFGAEDFDYKTLDDEAAEIAPGSEGLVALETFQGSRTPVTDPLARGALVGLNLIHTRGHIWRSLMEAVCFGTRSCVGGLEKAGHKCDEIIIAGGTTRSKLWLQMHADVTGKPVVLCENIDAPLLGCAILASVGAGIHESVNDAVEAMVRVSRRVEPEQDAVEAYESIYNEVYSKLSPSVRPVAHSLAKLRGGSMADDKRKILETKIIVSPSVLAADWAKMGAEIERCVNAGLTRLHVDVFDGVFLDSPNALTFGPQMVKAMRDVSDETTMDIHLCVERPARFIEPLANAGANSIIFQFEAIGDTEEAIGLGRAIRAFGVTAGVSINPQTPVEEIQPLLQSRNFDIVDILAVEPGFGGQKFQEVALKKLRELKSFREAHKLTFTLMVDGGMNKETCRLVRSAGANIVVAGTFLFCQDSIEEGAKDLLDN